MSFSAIASAGPANFAELYERVLVPPLFQPWSEQILHRVPLAPGTRVLDVACGTGIAGRLVRQRLGETVTVVGVDRNPAMLALARTIEPGIDWREGDAASLPLGGDERFDVVLCHQGVQFFPDRGAAVLEMRRTLAPGGHVVIGVWRSLEENGLFHELGTIAERFVGPIVDGRHGFADADALHALLAGAGFADVRVEPVTMDVHFAVEPAVLARLNAVAVVGMSAAGKALSDAERSTAVERIVEASVETVARHVANGVITFPTSANIGVAR